jgi:hypothetical protein
MLRVPFNIGRDPRTSPTGKLIVGITPEGKHQVDSFEGSGDKWDVLCALSFGGRPMSIGMLAHEAQIGYAACLRACKQLKAQGLITQMPTGMGTMQQ